MSLLLSLNKVGESEGGSIDPSTLSPNQHFNELGVNDPVGEWGENLSAAVFNSKTLGVSATIYNSLACWHTPSGGNNNLKSTISIPNVFNFANIDEWLTFYFVVGIKSNTTDNRYPFQFIGDGGATGLYGFCGTDGQITFIVRDASSNMALQLTGADMRDGIPRVYAWRIKNKTNDMMSDLWINKVKNVQVIQNPFTALARTGDNATLFNLASTASGASCIWCEVIFFIAEHSDEQCEGVSEFLLNKWTV